MEKHLVQVCMRAGLWILPLAIVGCTQLTVTPASTTPSVVFIQQEPVEEKRTITSAAGEEIVEARVHMLASVIGQLVLDNRCLRVQDAYSDTSYLLVWQPEHALLAEEDTVRVFDERGQTSIRVGEEVCLGGGGRASLEQSSEYLRQQVPPDCPGPYWIVGLNVRSNIQSSSDLVTVDLVSTIDRSLFLLRRKSALDEWTGQDSELVGELGLHTRCLSIRSVYHPVPYTPLWPAGYSARISSDRVEIVNEQGQAVGQVGQENRSSGRQIPANGDSELYRHLSHKMPCECGGPYWLVEDVSVP